MPQRYGMLVLQELAAENNVKVAFDGNSSLRLDGFHRRCLYAERAILRCMGLTKAEVPIPRSRQGDPMVGLVIGPQVCGIDDGMARTLHPIMPSLRGAPSRTSGCAVGMPSSCCRTMGADWPTIV